MLAREGASFWRENVVVILLRVLARVARECRSGGNKLSNVWNFSILQSREGSNSFNNDNSANFPGEKKYNGEFRGVYFLTIREKTGSRSRPRS